MLRPHRLALVVLLLAVAPSTAQAPSVVIDSIRAEGGLSLPAVRAVVERGLGGIRACYEARAREVPNLAVAMRLRVYVSPGGEPDAATIEATTLEDAPLGTCIAGRVAEWAFTSSSGAPTNVFVVFRFGGANASELEAVPATRPYGGADGSRETPGIRPDPVPPMESRVTLGEPVVRGARAAHEVRDALARRIFTLRSCYELALDDRPGLAGHLVLRFEVGADGRVSRAAVDEGSLREPRVAACVERLVRRLELPARPGGGAAEIEATVSFRPPPSTASP